MPVIEVVKSVGRRGVRLARLCDPEMIVDSLDDSSRYSMDDQLGRERDLDVET